MDKLEMQIAWGYIKKLAFLPELKDAWIKELNKFSNKKIGNSPQIWHKNLTEFLNFNVILLKPQISNKHTLKISSLIPEIAFEINLHYDPMYNIESGTNASKKIGEVLKSEDDVVAVLKNYIAHPAIHFHLPEISDKLHDEKDPFHEIRIAAGSENFFYLMYQIYFQIIDFENRYDNSTIKKAELQRLAKIIWHKRNKIEPIGPGILFPTGKN